MGRHGCSDIMKHLTAARVIPVIVAVQEIPNRLVRDRPDGFDHIRCVVRIH